MKYKVDVKTKSSGISTFFAHEDNPESVINTHIKNKDYIQFTKNAITHLIPKNEIVHICIENVVD